MARGINKVILIGNLGNDPEVKVLTNNTTVVNLKLATSEQWKDKNTGEQQERTEWHTVVLFNKLAEISGKYLKKGSKVYIEGSLKTEKWKDKEGNERYTTKIIGNEMQMLSGVSHNKDNYKSEPISEPLVQNDTNLNDDIPF